jgi:1,4-dihydroxy-2-naphthoate octaprenyltransferase
VRREELKTLVVHLRLHFQLLLAPVFLWGWLVAGGGLSVAVAIAFVAFHVFLYSGATAFNSYYDRDIGPVGGIERPPPVPASLLPLALFMQGIGWALAALVNLPFWLAYGAFVGLSTTYSHPRTRLKAHTLTSLLVVGSGQGVLAFVAAWAATRGEVASAWSLDGVLGATAAMALILALYPLTQLYQIEEDAARGDRTVAVAWGPAACFRFSLICTLIGGAAMVTLVLRRFGLVDATVVALGLGLQVVAIGWLAQGFDARVIVETYRRVMGVNALSAGALGAYLLVRLALASRQDQGGVNAAKAERVVHHDTGLLVEAGLADQVERVVVVSAP